MTPSREHADACRLEAEALAELARTAGDDDPAFAAITIAARAIAARPGLGSLTDERDLDALSLRLRKAVLARAHEYSDPHFRSPAHGPARPLPSGGGVGFVYERSALPEGLEARVAAGAPAPHGYRSDHVVFGSGMAAISCVLQCYRSMIRPTEANPVRAAVWGSYFETDMLYELMRSGAFEWESVTDLEGALTGGGFDVLHVEPVRYDWDLTAMDVQRFVRAWRTRPSRRTRVLVLDTTLASFTWPTQALLTALRDGSPLLVVELRSGLKLDQQGLELANVGVVSVYSCHEDAGTPTAEQFAQYLRMVRSLTGTSLSMDALAALDAPFVFDPQWTVRHAGQVFLNNRTLAEALATEDGVFSRIGHPGLDARGPLGHAPFVVCQLAEDTIDNHGFLLGVVAEGVRRSGAGLTWGSSFGFRSHRWETIVPRIRDRKGLFKIAMGSRAGPSSDLAVRLFTRLARYPDFDALRADHPHVEPVDLMALVASEPSAARVDRPPVREDEPALLVDAGDVGGLL